MSDVASSCVPFVTAAANRPIIIVMPLAGISSGSLTTVVFWLNPLQAIAAVAQHRIKEAASRAREEAAAAAGVAAGQQLQAAQQEAEQEAKRQVDEANARVRAVQWSEPGQ